MKEKLLNALCYIFGAIAWVWLMVALFIGGIVIICFLPVIALYSLFFGYQKNSYLTRM
jgi:hypothetical protein